METAAPADAVATDRRTPLAVVGFGASTRVRDETRVNESADHRNRLAAVLESSSAAVLVMDLEGRIRVWNRGAEKLYGYTAREVVGQPFEMLIPAEVHESFQTFAERLHRGEVIVDYETTRLDRNGNRVDVAKTIFLIPGLDGAAEEVCAIDTDIRPRKRLEQKMAELLDQERLRVAHELHDTLGQQITGIGMMVASLRSQAGAGSPLAVPLAQLEETAEQAKAQVRMLIRGIFPVTVEAAGLEWALRDLAQETSRLYGVACTFEPQGGMTGVEDKFTATQLFLIAREAVHNAVRHGRAKHIAVRLSDDEGVRLTIEDDGIGIPKDVDQNATMGLRIMQHRSQRVGGMLLVEPRKQGGTIVTAFRRLRRRS